MCEAFSQAILTKMYDQNKNWTGKDTYNHHVCYYFMVC